MDNKRVLVQLKIDFICLNFHNKQTQRITETNTDSNLSREQPIYCEDHFLCPALPLAGMSHKCDSVNSNTSTN